MRAKLKMQSVAKIEKLVLVKLANQRTVLIRICVRIGNYFTQRESEISEGIGWTTRPSDQFSMPRAYMRDLLRFNRQEVDLWAKQEAERRRVQNEKRRLKIA